MKAMPLYFQENGYVVLKNILSSKEATEFSQQLQLLAAAATSEDQFRWDREDGVSKTPSFWPLIFHERLLEIVRQILASTEIRYTEQSALKVWHQQSASGWHRDSVSQEFGIGSEWSRSISEYKIVRVAFYLQPWEDGFYWGAIPGSHRSEFQLRLWDKFFWQLVLPRPQVEIGSRLKYLDVSRGRLWIRTKPVKFLTKPPTSAVWLRTKPTDCVIFDPRLIHAGGHVKHHKYAAFVSFGVDNELSRNHASYYSHPQLETTGNEVRCELIDKLRAAGLSLI